MASTSPARTAVVVGATGATGAKVVEECLRRGWEVVAFARRAPELPPNTSTSHFKLVQVPDLTEASLAQTKDEDWKKDVVFNCIGTTRATAGSAENFVHIERDMSIAVMKRAKQVGVDQVSVVSAGSANASAPAVTWFHPLLYMATLGQKEQAAIDAGFARVSIFAPGMLDRERPLDSTLSQIFSYLPGKLRVSILARAMVNDAEKRLSTREDSTKNGVQRYVGNSLISRIAEQGGL